MKTTRLVQPVFACLASFVLLLTALPGRADVSDQRMVGIAEEGMSLWSVPGLAVSVVTPDGIRFQQGFGQTSIENGTPVDEHTLFAIASTTKAMVVAGILMLADEGKLSLDEPVIRTLPELRFADPVMTRQVMLSDLLAHRTGLPSTDMWTFMLEMPLEEQIDRLQAVEPEAPLRTRLIYQNTMFELAGLVIERVSGTPWHEFLTERLWRPIGMNETYGSRGMIPAGRQHVMPHDRKGDAVVLVDWDLDADLADAAGSAWSSVHDMSLWAQFLLRNGVTSGGERLISEELMSAMFEPRQLAAESDFYPTTRLTRPNWRSYGLGWFQQDFQGRKIDFHTGSLSGLIAIIGLDRANGLGTVVLGNLDHAEMRHAVLWEVMDQQPAGERRDWNRDIFDLYAGNANEAHARWEQLEAERLTGTVPSLPLDAYTGFFEAGEMGVLNIAKEGDGLVLRMPRFDMPMTHWHIDSFLVAHEPWNLREFISFEIGPEGKVEEMTWLGVNYRRVDGPDQPAD